MMPGMKKTNCNFVNKALPTGSALILAVVLTSMLAIVGILFVMMARVEKVATSSISENRELDLAVETVIAKISQQLILDVPGILVQEYYDYPDVNNTWLASLEPELNDGGTPADLTDDIYYWRQISDVNNQLGPGAWDLQAFIIPDYQPPLQIGDSNVVLGVYPADADADGVSDSVWIKIPDITSSKGEPIYAAVRVVDNEAMLNVNTAWKFEFDPNVFVDANRIDGSSQTQINLAALSLRGNNGTLAEAADTLQNVRCGIEPNDIFMYQKNVVWRYHLPVGAYTPFDISDELELRNRFLVNIPDIDTRIEETWDNVFQIGKRTPFDSNLPEWYQRSYHDMFFPNVIYSYRHIGTTYNMDRIIDPNGEKMINVNAETSPLKIYDRLRRSMYPFVPDPNTDQHFAQLAVNMVDFADDDPHPIDSNVLDPCCVTTLIDTSGIIHYGFEAQPFINEIAWRIGPSPAVTSNFFALELCNPFDKHIDLGNFVLEFVSRDGAKKYSIFPANLTDQIIEANGYYVIVNQAGRFAIYTDPNTPTKVVVDPTLRFFEDWLTFDKSKPPVDLRPNPDKSKPPIPEGWGTIYDVSLLRSVPSTMLYVDNQIIDTNQALPGTALAFGRDDRDWRVIYQTLTLDGIYGGSLGIANYRHIPFYDPDPRYQYPRHLYSFFLPNPLDPRARLITVGDIPRILTLGHGTTRDSTIGRQLMAYELLEVNTLVDQEHNVRLDLQNPLHRNVFQYLTVFDPNSDNIDNDADGLTDENDGSEWKVPGRININTAPWYVLAQLPWVSAHTPSYELARAIIAYRNKAALAGGPDYTARPGGPGFGSIGELNFVIAALNNFNIGFYAFDAIDLPGFPDLTTADDDPPYAIPDVGDEVIDDFEERDVIFSRISNLVSVRSDVFTAYILVRIGADGPQKRVIAILDRSGVNRMNVGLPAGRVRIVSLHDVPDPR